jgi:predicted HAD superfamily Cof-like phosphohydrolase
MTNDNEKTLPFDPFEAVQEFYKAAGFEPTEELAHSLVSEEAREVLQAATNLIKELCDLEYVIIGAIIGGHHTTIPMEINEEIQSVAPLFDLIPQEILSEAFQRVHRSNMSKLTDGKLVRDEETGKVLKGPNYRPPYLDDLV